MRILVFFTYGVSLKIWKDTGLLEREIKLYNNFVSKGAQITFITYGDESDQEYPRYIPNIKVIPYYQYSKKPKNKLLKLIDSFFMVFKLKSLIKDGDIIKTKQVMGGWNAIIAKWVLKIPAVIRCGFEPNEFAAKQQLSIGYRLFLYISSFFSYHLADRIFVATENDRIFIRKYFQIREEKILIFPNWVDTNMFVNERKLSYQRRALSISRLTPQKNLFNMIDAFANANVGLDIIGDGELYSDIKKYIEDKNLDIKLLGKVPNSEIPRIMQNYQVYAQCSHYEGNPKTLLEAMGCSKIVIATDVPGIREIVKHGETGLLSKTDSDSIAANVISVFENSDKYIELGMKAAIEIEQNFSLKGTTEKELHVYNELIRNK